MKSIKKGNQNNILLPSCFLVISNDLNKHQTVLEYSSLNWPSLIQVTHFLEWCFVFEKRLP